MESDAGQTDRKLCATVGIAASRAAMAASLFSTVLTPLPRGTIARLPRAEFDRHRSQIALGSADPAGEAAQVQARGFANIPHTV